MVFVINMARNRPFKAYLFTQELEQRKQLIVINKIYV